MDKQIEYNYIRQSLCMRWWVEFVFLNCTPNFDYFLRNTRTLKFLDTICDLLIIDSLIFFFFINLVFHQSTVHLKATISRLSDDKR